MSEKVYIRILIIIAALGVLSAAALLAYTYYLYGDASIISYIANGR